MISCDRKPPRIGIVHNVSAALLLSSISAWLDAHPEHGKDHARVESLRVTDKLLSSELDDTDISDTGLANAAMFFPRDHQVSLFRFFCHVRAWSSTQNPKGALTNVVVDSTLAVEPSPTREVATRLAVRSPVRTVTPRTVTPATPEPTIIDLVALESATTSPPIAVTALDTTRPSPAPQKPQSSTPGTTAWQRAPQRPTSRALDVHHPLLRCPHSSTDLAAMPASRATVASIDFDLYIDTSWHHTLAVTRRAIRLAGDPSWTLDEHSPAEQASLTYRSSPSASPSISATVSCRATDRGRVISFRVVDVRSSVVRSLLSRRDQARPARLLARKLAWGFLPDDLIAQS